MPIDAIGIVPDPAASTPRNAVVSQESFMRILITQLRNQDPSKPMDSSAFLAQLAQFSALELTRQQNAGVDSLLNIQATNQAIALVGKQVELRGDRAGTKGNVTAVSFSTGQPKLTVTTPSVTLVDVSLSDISLVF